MICSQNLLNNRSIPVSRPATAPHRPCRSPASLTIPARRPSEPHRAPLTAQALLSPEHVAMASEVVTQAATLAGGAAGVLRGKEMADRVKEQLALAAFLLPRTADSQRMEGTAARSAEACYDAAAVLATGLLGASLMHALARALPLAHISQF